jgi:hypothetical protein
MTIMLMFTIGYVSPNTNAAGAMGELTGKLLWVVAAIYIIFRKSRRGLATLICSALFLVMFALMCLAAISGRITEQRTTPILLRCLVDIREGAQRVTTAIEAVGLANTLNEVPLSAESLKSAKARVATASKAVDDYAVAYKRIVESTVRELRTIDTTEAEKFLQGVNRSHGRIDDSIAAWRMYLAESHGLLVLLEGRVGHFRGTKDNLLFESMADAEAFNESMRRVDAARERLNTMAKTMKAEYSKTLPPLLDQMSGNEELKRKLIPAN